MGFDKATLAVEGERLAVRLLRLLRAVADPVIEVGSGVSGAPAHRETPAGQGPLVAISSGTGALSATGFVGPVVVLACDLPMLDAAVLEMLAAWPGQRSVVPLVGGHPQPLCARWSEADLRVAGELVADGERSMRSLLARCRPEFLDESHWAKTVGADAFSDADTPADLDRLAIPWSDGQSTQSSEGTVAG